MSIVFLSQEDIIKKPFVKNKIRKYCFSIPVKNDWSSLPPGVVNAVSLDGFKINLGKTGPTKLI